MTKWNSVEKTKSWKNWQKAIPALIGMLIFLILLLLSSCVKTQYVYQEIEREPIDCDKNIETPIDMAKCLQEFRQKW